MRSRPSWQSRRSMPIGTGTAKFDLALGFADVPDGFHGSIEFNTDLFEARDHRTVRAALRQATRRPGRPSGTAGCPSCPARRSASVEMSPVGSRAVQLGRSAGSARSARAAGHPRPLRGPGPGDALRLGARRGREDAVVCGIERACEPIGASPPLAGVGPEVRVGLLLDDPIHRIVAAPGVLKAGGADLPLEPSTPPRGSRTCSTSPACPS